MTGTEQAGPFEARRWRDDPTVHPVERQVLGTLCGLGDGQPAAAAVAVSGGGDSIALLVAVAAAAARYGFRARAVTVDHGLRPAAATEAAVVATLCAYLGVDHDIIRIEQAPPATGIPAWARDGRYRALEGWARRRQAQIVLIGHTADDVAETFAMRLSRAAGLSGLAEMRRDWRAGLTIFARPFLRTSRADLRSYLVEKGIEWSEDPTNDDLAFERARVRAALAQTGADIGAIAASARHLRAAQEALGQATADLARRSVRIDMAGDALVDLAAAAHLGPELRRRLLIGILGWIGRAPHAPRHAEQEVLRETFPHPDIGMKTLTLGGCILRGDGAGVLRIGREPARVPQRHMKVSDQHRLAPWDGRWHLSGADADPQDAIGPLGEAGLALCPGWRATGAARASLLAGPAIWRDGTLIAAPLARDNSGWTARIVADLPSWLLSH